MNITYIGICGQWKYWIAFYAMAFKNFLFFLTSHFCWKHDLLVVVSVFRSWTKFHVICNVLNPSKFTAEKNEKQKKYMKQKIVELYKKKNKTEKSNKCEKIIEIHLICWINFNSVWTWILCEPWKSEYTRSLPFCYTGIKIHVFCTTLI